MCVELQEDKKQFENIKTRKDLKKYLFSITQTGQESELLEKSKIQRDFLRRVVGDNGEPKAWVKDENAYDLCKLIASYEKKSAKEVLEILIRNGLLPDDIKPNRKKFEEDAIENIEGLTACVKEIIKNMHFKIKEKDWKFKSGPGFQTIEVEKDSILLVGIEAWTSIWLAYLCTDTSDKDFEQVYEELRTHGKDKRALFLFLCQDRSVYEKVYERLMMLKSENSILLISLEKTNEVYIMSMHNKHSKVFDYEKNFASYIEDEKKGGCIFWSYK